ncbi:MAG: RHS repeat-associated core domain-containing protein [Terriglobia bacterium]
MNDAFGKEYAEINTTQSSVDYNNFWLGDRIFAKYDQANGTVFLHPNNVGSTVMTTGPTNNPIGAEIFYPFGQSWGSGGTLEEERFAKFRQRDIGTGLDYTLNRMYPSWQGRWLTPDPGGKNVVSLGDPQTWNMYAYARNNPTTLTDPSGLYTLACASGDKRCAKAAADWEKNRQKDLRSKHGDVRAAAAAWGDPGQKNGVTVTFKTQAQVNADSGLQLALGTSVGGLVRVGQTADHTPDIHAEFSESQGGSDSRQAIAHEGAHLEDDMAFFQSYNPLTGLFSAALNFTHYQTEFSAYVIGAQVKRYNESCGGQPCSFGPRPRDWGTIDRFLTSPGGAYAPHLNDPVFDPGDYPQQ